MPNNVKKIDHKEEILEICEASRQMRDAVNDLWKAQNKDDFDDPALSVEEAIRKHADAFTRLQRAEYYMRKRFLDAEN